MRQGDQRLRQVGDGLTFGEGDKPDALDLELGPGDLQRQGFKHLDGLASLLPLVVLHLVSRWALGLR